MEHIVIIGNGISGVTAARHIRKKSNSRITIISGESDYFFSRTALMYVFMGHMKFENTQPYENGFWAKNSIGLKKDWVKRIDFENKEIFFSEDSEPMHYDKLILALGSVPNKFGWKGQDLEGVQGLYSLQDLEKLENTYKNIKNAVIVGGGLIGIELAEMLLMKGIKVDFLIRESNFWSNVLPLEESNLVSNHIKKHHLNLIFEDELDEIAGHERVEKIITKKGKQITCEFVGITVGVSPNIGFLKTFENSLELNKGILVNEYLETSIPEVYAIGDCVEHRNPPNNRRNIEQIWYSGRMMGETVAQTIFGNSSAYKPGVFFNSAKFFDLEYQTYGIVGATLKEGEQSFYWEHTKDEKAFRINFNKENQQVLGCNTFGIRMRHQIWDAWISEGKSVDYVMTHLNEVIFDPEFSKNYCDEIVKEYNLKFNKNLSLISKGSFFSKLFGK